MKYINAKFLLPDALVKELQHYIQGGYLYIPTDPTQQKCWGDKSGYHLCVNTSGMNIKDLTPLIAEYAKYYLRRNFE